jgi:two-component system, LuxR family, sensor kinase FixL
MLANEVSLDARLGRVDVLDGSNAGKLYDERACLAALLEAAGGKITVFGVELKAFSPSLTSLFQGRALSALEISAAQLLRDMSPRDMATFQLAFRAIVGGETNAVGRPFYLASGGANTNQTLVCSLAPIRNSIGDIVAVVCLSRFDDIKQDHQSTIAYKEAMLTAILATVPDAMVVIDEYGYITSFSAAAQTLFGWTEAEILGRNVSILMPKAHSGAHDGYLQRYIQTGEKRIIGLGRAIEGQRCDGSIFPMELSVGEARTANHRAFTGFIRDLTKRHQTEAQLEKVQSELIHASRLSDVGTLVSALAHELNQPLTAIANYTSTGRDMVGDDRPQTLQMLRDALDEAAKETVRAGLIIRRLRDFVSKGEMDLQILSLGKLMTDAAALGLLGARDQGVTWKIDIDPGIENVLADRVQIQQVMVNLIRNAIEAMEGSPIKELTLRSRCHLQNQVEISVTDTGHGLSEEVAAELFQPFVSSKPQGMGLGLSICRTIVEAHGGKLSVVENPDGGAIFRFTLTRVTKDSQNDN